LNLTGDFRCQIRGFVVPLRGHFGRKELSIHVHQGCHLHVRIWTCSYDVDIVIHPVSGREDTNLGQGTLKRTRAPTEKTFGVDTDPKARVKLELDLCFMHRDMHESGLGAGDLRRRDVPSSSITNTAEPDDLATRVCCKTHSDGSSLLPVMHREL
jgi:hypothetical protein